MRSILVTSLLAVFIVIPPEVHSVYYQAATRLNAKLFGNNSDYDKYVRPLPKTIIYIQILLKSLGSMNIADETMSMKYIATLTWYDPRLTWSPADYEDITKISVDPTKPWFPPVYVENKVTSEGVLESNVPPIVVNAGYISWSTEISSETSCEVTTKHYPFDRQFCTIRYSVWGNTDEIEFSFTEKPYFTDFYLPNGEWDLSNISATIENVQWDEYGETYQTIIYVFELNRRKPYYLTAIIVPVLLLSVLIVAVFWVPIESGEKIGYCLDILLTYVLFLSIVSDELPPIATDISYLQVYLAISMGMGVMATLMTTMVLHVYHKGEKEVAPWLRGLTVLFLQPVTCKTCCPCCREGSDGGVANGATGGVTMVANSNMNHGFLRHVEHEVVTYQTVAKMLDRLFLLIYSVVMIGVTVAMLILMLMPQGSPYADWA